MFTRLLLSLSLALTFLGPLIAPAAAESSPAAYITEVTLTGQDRTEGTAIRREGALLRPRLLMALYAGDEIVLREAASRIVIETEGGSEQVVTGAQAVHKVMGDIAADDGLWGLLDAVADAIGGGSDEAVPDNMMTRDDGKGLRIPMAANGANHLVRSNSPVWIAWSGGAAPFRVTVSAGEEVKVIEGITGHEANVSVPPAAASRFRVKVEDAGGRTDTILFRLRDERPEPPHGATEQARGLASDLAYAAWLTGLEDGSWTIEAARMLTEQSGSGGAASLLRERIAAGWKLPAGD